MNKRKTLQLLMIGIVIAVQARTSAGAATEPLQVTDLLSITGVPLLTQSVAMSPDGSQIAYVTETASDDRHFVVGDWVNWGQRILWIQSVTGGLPIRIETPEGYEPARGTNPSWSPDGRDLIYYVHNNHRGRVALWNAATRRVRLLDIPIDPMGLFNSIECNFSQWSSDSRSILAKRLPDDQDTAPTSSPMPPITVYTNMPVTSNTTESGVRVAKSPGDLVLVNVLTGTVTPLVRGVPDSDLVYWRLSRDGTKLLVIVRTGTVSNNTNRYTISIVDVLTGSSVVVVDDVIMARWAPWATWSHDGSKIAFVGNLKDDPNKIINSAEGYPGRCYVLDARHPGLPRQLGGLEFAHTQLIRWSGDDTTLYLRTSKPEIKAISLATGESEGLLRDAALSQLGDSVFDAGKEFYVRAMTNDGATRIYEIDDRSCRSRVVLQGFKTMFDLSSSRDGSHTVWAQEDHNHPPDLWVGNRDFSGALQLTHLNPQIEKKSLDSLQQTVTWLSRGGASCTGVVLLPTGYSPGKKYPMLVYVYPNENTGTAARTRFGMFGSESRVYMNSELYASRGYAVFVPDSSLRVGHPMQDIADVILPGVDKVVEMGIANPARLGVFGESYGGYAVFSLIVQSTRFKAAVSISGFSNYISHYAGLHSGGEATGASWAEDSAGAMGGTPWQYRDRYIENSPFFYFDRIETPVLIQFGSEDNNVLPYESGAAFVALRRLGKPAVLVGYAGERHSIRAPANEIDFFDRVIAWFDKYVKGELAQEHSPPSY